MELKIRENVDIVVGEVVRDNYFSRINCVMQLVSAAWVATGKGESGCVVLSGN